eukprot:6761088-Lingulodinium_polyedra.AAC.1
MPSTVQADGRVLAQSCRREPFWPRTRPRPAGPQRVVRSAHRRLRRLNVVTVEYRYTHFNMI